jgi:TonB family protein
MMIVLAWVLHCLVIAGVLTAAAYAWESSARWSGRSARWGWLGAMAGSLALPWLVRLVPESAAGALPVAMPVLTLDALVLDATTAGSGVNAMETALVLWLASTVLVLGYVTLALWGLARQRRRWRAAELEDGPVLVAQNVGPAVVGVRAPVVVLPAWALQLDAELRSLLLRHEREHVRAGDPRLLLTALLLLAAMPWNPFVWLQVLRLRNAIELDCDTRVLSRGADPERYGALLLEVGRRRAAHAPVMATFAEPRVFLEQRIRRIAQWPQAHRPARAFAFALIGLALFATALSARDPLRRSPLGQPGAPDPAAAPAVRDVVLPSDTPPMTKRPELRNAAQVQEAVHANYPPLLRDAGISGAPSIALYVDERGRVERMQISRSSGYPALDQAALNVAAVMQFSPGENERGPVGVWIELPIGFGPNLRDVQPERVRVPAPPRAPQPEPAPSPERVPAPARAPADIRAAPSFTPMTVRPELSNRAELQGEIGRVYPPLLRDAGIGGTAIVWLFVNEAGTVERSQLSRTSGYHALDDAALAVAAIAKFTPAKNRDRDVPVWIEIPIAFTAR